MRSSAKTEGHPKGLYVLFFTEMWERFSYYGMRAILIYYMTKQLLFAQEKASTVYGWYTALVYATPFFGGMLADKLLGQRKTVVIGAVLMAIGQMLLGIGAFLKGGAGTSELAFFYGGLLFLIVGNGAFKPNISTQVGGLYEHGDHRRDSAFSIFYMGINLGAFFSPLICGTLGEVYGWHWGFFSAAIGMLAGLGLYLWGQKYLAPDNVMKKGKGADAKKEKPLTEDDWKKISALIILCFINIIFWAVYEQQGNTLALWADQNTDRHIFGAGSWEMPASWVQSFNPFMIFAFTPLITMLWSWQSAKNKEPSSIAKMAYGCILLGVSFLIMIIPGTAAADPAVKVSIWWLVGCTFLLTVGELYLSPVGLSLVTKLAPARYVSMLMGTWFLSSFVGNYLCGYIGTFWEKMSKQAFFLMLALLSFAAGMAMLAVLKPLKKAIGHGKKEVEV